MKRDGPGILLADILSGEDPQVEAVLRVVRHANPDVLVLGGFDFDLGGVALDAFADRLEGYAYRFASRPNRGRPSGLDLDGDGRVGGPGDAVGYAAFQGQSGLAVLSRYPIDSGGVIDFTSFHWSALPGHQALENVPPDFPLSTTGHWSVPLMLPSGAILHVLTWHATPPVFDGPEDRNGRRNHDETALWLAYLNAALPYPPPEDFVVAGFANLDPIDGDGRPEALNALLAHTAVTDPKPKSPGGVAHGDAGHQGDPALDTVDWPEERGGPGNLRVDYVLPSATLTATGSGVLWPDSDGSLSRDVERASRHRLVWVDVQVTDRGANGRQGIGVAELGQK